MHKSEKIFAEQLSNKGLEYIYHPCKFNLIEKHYQPDFYVPDEDIYYEVVANYGAYLNHKKDFILMEKNYPHIKLKVVMPDGRIYAKGIKFEWASKYVHYPIQLPKDIINQIKEIAIKKDMTVSKIINESIIKYAGQCKELERGIIEKKWTGISLALSAQEYLKKQSAIHHQSIRSILYFCCMQFINNNK